MAYIISTTTMNKRLRIHEGTGIWGIAYWRKMLQAEGMALPERDVVTEKAACDSEEEGEQPCRHA
jgi:hypothetical protein